MTDRPELTRMLAEHAAAADLAPVDDQRLAASIRRRRRARRATTVLVPVGLTLAVGAIWMIAPPPDRPGDPPPTPPAQTRGGVVLGECGTTVTGSVQPDSRLTMSAEVPARASGALRIPVTVTNAGPALRAITATHPDVTVVRAGLVVATPAAIRDAGRVVELPAGQGHTFDTPVNLTPCARDGAPVLEPGTYQLYATQRFDPQPSGDPVEVQGGPWTVELR
jgi:hypothetical protein